MRRGSCHVTFVLLPKKDSRGRYETARARRKGISENKCEIEVWSLTHTKAGQMDVIVLLFASLGGRERRHQKQSEGNEGERDSCLPFPTTISFLLPPTS